MPAIPAPATPTRQRRKEARPQEIVAAALDVFAEKGFAATKLDAVAARAGVSKGTLYLYFSSKEELFKAVVRETLLPHLDRLEALAEGAEGPVLPLLETFLGGLARNIRTTRLAAIPRLVIAEAPAFPELARFYAEAVIARALAAIGRLLARGIERGELRPVDLGATLPCLVAPLLVAALFETAFRPITGDTLPSAEAIVAAHLDLLRHGLLRREPSDG